MLEILLENIPGEQIAVVVPHPDDETAAHAAVLARYPNLVMIQITDGGTNIESAWKSLPSREAYAALRQRELTAALDAANHTGKRICLDVVDGHVLWHVDKIELQLCALFCLLNTKVVFTLAYEGGHPDHDATALAVRRAVARLPGHIKIIESPMYRLEPGGATAMERWAWQRFIPVPGVPELAHILNEKTRAMKRAMVQAHASQVGILRFFSENIELYRIAPLYDFSRPANYGQYTEIYHWHGIDPDIWTREYARIAL